MCSKKNEAMQDFYIGYGYAGPLYSYKTMTQEVPPNKTPMSVCKNVSVQKRLCVKASV